jgi:four helix bundle protein
MKMRQALISIARIAVSHYPRYSESMPLFSHQQGISERGDYSLIGQIRRSSRSVRANLAEAWRKRQYEKAFLSKLNDTEGEAAETQVWIEISVKCGYMERETGRRLYTTYDEIIGTIVGMINHPTSWILPGKENHLSEEGASYLDFL